MTRSLGTRPSRGLRPKARPSPRPRERYKLHKGKGKGNLTLTVTSLWFTLLLYSTISTVNTDSGQCSLSDSTPSEKQVSYSCEDVESSNGVVFLPDFEDWNEKGASIMCESHRHRPGGVDDHVFLVNKLDLVGSVAHPFVNGSQCIIATGGASNKRNSNAQKWFEWYCWDQQIPSNGRGLALPEGFETLYVCDFTVTGTALSGTASNYTELTYSETSIGCTLNQTNNTMVVCGSVCERDNETLSCSQQYPNSFCDYERNTCSCEEGYRLDSTGTECVSDSVPETGQEDIIIVQCSLNESTTSQRQVSYSCGIVGSSNGLALIPDIKDWNREGSTMCENHVHHSDGDVDQHVFLVNKLDLVGSVAHPFVNGSQCITAHSGVSDISIVNGPEWFEWYCWDQQMLSNGSGLVVMPEGFEVLYICNFTVTDDAIPSQENVRLTPFILINESPTILGNLTTFLLITQEVDTPVTYFLHFGDSTNITVTFDETALGNNANVYNIVFNPIIDTQLSELSVEWNDTQVTTVQHMYLSVGQYQAELVAVSEDGLNQTDSCVVYIQRTPCSLPTITLTGGGSLDNPQMFLASQDIILYSSYVLDCPAISNAVYQWTVSERSNTEWPSKQESPIQLPRSIVSNLPNLILSPCALSYGLYMVRVSVSVVTDVETGATVAGSAETWISVTPSALVAILAGGSAKKQGLDLPIELDGSASRDPDVCKSDISSLEFTWYCIKGDSTGLSDSSVMDVLEEGAQTVGLGCQGLGYKLPQSSSKVRLVDISLPATYRFILVVSKGSRPRAVTQQYITLVQGHPPLVDIICSVNCELYLNPSQRLVLSASCSNCNTGETVNFLWSFMPQFITNSKQDIDWQTESLTGQRRRNIVVKAGVFDELIQEQFTFGVTVTRGDGAEGYAEMSFSTNTAPIGGSCQPWPNEGTVLETKFTITCTDFQDGDLPLTYKYFVVDRKAQSMSDIISRTLLYHGYDATSPSMFLKAGAEADNFRVGLEVEISDRYGASSQVDFWVTVKEAQLEVDTLHNLTTGEKSVLQQLVKSGDIQAVSQLIGAVTSLLNKESKSHGGPGDGTVEEREQRKTERKELREKMIWEISTMPVQSMESLQQASTAVSDMTEVADELTAEAKTTAASALLSLSYVLQTSSADQHNSRETVEESGRLILSGLSNLLATVSPTTAESPTNEEAVDSSQNATVNENRGIAMTTLSALDEVKAALLASKVAGETATVVETDTMVVQLARSDPDHLASATFSLWSRTEASTDHVDVKNQIHLPDSLNISQLIGADVKAINTEVVQFKSSPYTWSASHGLVSSAVSDFVLRTTESVVNISGGILEDNPIDIYLPVDSLVGVSEPATVNLTTTTTVTLLTNVSEEYSSLVIFLSANTTERAVATGGTLEVLVGKSTNGTFPLDSYSRNTSDHNVKSRTLGVVELETNTNTTPFLTVPVDQLQGAGEYAIRLRVSSLPERDQTLQVDIHLRDSYCLYWEPKTEMWASDGCKVGSASSLGHVHCTCTHLTSFASGMLIMPNTFDFATELAKFSTFWKNPVAIAFIVCAMVLYGILVVWARRKDRCDVIKAAPTDLADNHPLAEYPYAVVVYTGSRRGAGTTATVALMLIGDQGRCSPHLLKHKGSDISGNGDTACDQGSVDVFIVRTRKPLGRIQALRFWHNNKGKHPEWFVSRVTVEDLARGRMYYFMCDSWLASNIGDGQVDRTFGVASEDDVKQFGHLFRSRTSRGIKDSHVWFSVITRPVRSTFTRVQRLSCCLGLFMTYMLVNIMFYGVDDTLEGDQSMDLGPSSLSLNQVIIGLESALIAVPINILIVQLFRRSRRRPAKNSYLKTLGDKFFRQRLSSPSLPRRSTTVDISDVRLESVELGGSTVPESQHGSENLQDQGSRDLDPSGAATAENRMSEQSSYMIRMDPEHEDYREVYTDAIEGQRPGVLVSTTKRRDEQTKQESFYSPDQVSLNEKESDEFLPPLYDEYYDELNFHSSCSIASHQSSHKILLVPAPDLNLQQADSEPDSSDIPQGTLAAHGVENEVNRRLQQRRKSAASFGEPLHMILEMLPDALDTENMPEGPGPAVDLEDKDIRVNQAMGPAEELVASEEESRVDPEALNVNLENISPDPSGVLAKGSDQNDGKNAQISYGETTEQVLRETCTPSGSDDSERKHNTVETLWTTIALKGFKEIYQREEAFYREIKESFSHILENVGLHTKDADRCRRQPGHEGCVDGGLTWQDTGRPDRMNEPRMSSKPEPRYTLSTLINPGSVTQRASSFYVRIVDSLQPSHGPHPEDQQSDTENPESEVDESEPSQPCLSSRLSFYAAWFLLVLTVSVSSFFTILYSFSYGRTVTMSWLKSLLVSFTTDILVSQPAKAVLLAAVFSAILRRPDDQEELMVAQEWEPDTTACAENEDNANSEWESQRCDPAYIPPNKRNVLIDGKQKQEQSRLYSILREFGGYFVFMYLVLLIMHGMRDRNIYRTNASLNNIFFNTRQYKNVTSLNTLWTWLNTSFVDGLYPDDPTMGIASHGGSLLVGSPILRQLRIRDSKCPTLSEDLPLTHSACKLPYAEENADTRDYLTKWQLPPNVSTQAGRPPDCWQYDPQRGYQTEGVIFRRYPVGGYVHQLGTSREDVMESLDYLYRALWIDKGTAAVLTEVVLYNVNTNLLSVVTSLVELPNVGGIFKRQRVDSIRLYRSSHGFHVIVLAFEIIYCLYTLCLLIVKVWQMIKLKGEFFRNVWNWMDLTIASLSLAAIGVYVTHTLEVIEVVKKYRVDSAVTFDHIRSLDSAFVNIMAVIVMLGTVKFLHIIRFNPRIVLFSRLLSDAVPLLECYLLTLAIFKIAFCVLFHLLLGSFSEYFRSIGASLQSLFVVFDLLTHDYYVTPFYHLHRVFGPIILFTYYMVNLFVIVNLVVAVLLETMSRLARKPIPDEDVAFMKHMVGRLQHWFTVKRDVKDQIKRKI